MQHRYTHGSLIWVDLESPTHEEVRALVVEFGLDAVTGEELLLPSHKSRVDVHDNYAYLVLHFPALRHTHKTQEQEVDFIIGKEFIITTRYEMIDPLHKFSKVFEVNSTLDKSNFGDHAGFIFYYMLKKLYKAVEHEVEYIKDSLEDIEAHIYQGKEKEMVVSISLVGRSLLNLRQAIEPHRDVLRTFEADGTQLFGEQFKPYLRSLSNTYYRVHNHIMRQTESLRELRETNNSLLSTKQNEIMKVLTIMAFVTFPLTLITGIFGMNTLSTPLAEEPHGFWYIMMIMIGAGALMFLYFKKKKWL